MSYIQLILFVLNVFSPVVFNRIDKVNIADEYEIDEYKVSYGSLFTEDIDGLLIISDINTSEEIVRIVYDDYGYEFFSYVAEISSNEIIVVCEKYYMSGDFELVFKEVLLMKYNLQGEKLSELEVQGEPKYYGNNRYYLIITFPDETIYYISNEMEFLTEIDSEKEHIDYYSTQYQGKAYINGEVVEEINIDQPGNYDLTIVEDECIYLYSISVYPTIIVSGEQYGDLYVGNFSVSSKGEIELNGSEYICGELIKTPGNYIISIYGPNNFIYQKSISVLPLITYSLRGKNFDFIDELSVTEAISIYSNGITILINGNQYNSESLTKTGEYSLSIYGVNNMQFDLSFYIYPKVSGLEDGGVYDEINFSVFGNAILNGELVTGELNLSVPGNYYLELMMETEVHETYNFLIEDANVTSEVIEDSKFNYNFIIFGLIALGGILILRKK